MFQLVQILVPLGICVVLPVLIVWIIFRSYINSDNKRAEVLIEAIRANNDIDASVLAKAFAKPVKTPLERLQTRLLRGCILSLVGLALTICSLCMFWAGGFDADAVELFFIGGLILLATGIGYLIVYFVTRKQLPNIHTSEEKE